MRCLAFALVEVGRKSLFHTAPLSLQQAAADDDENRDNDDEDADGARPMDCLAENVTDKDGTQHDAQQLYGGQRGAIEIAVLPQGLKGFSLRPLQHQSTQEGGQYQDGGQGNDLVGLRLGKQACQERIGKVHHHCDDGHTQDTIEEQYP